MMLALLVEGRLDDDDFEIPGDGARNSCCVLMASVGNPKRKV